jgi:penicillin-binding protein 1A
MKQAILAAEDERFYQHGGVDTLGVLRAAVRQPVSGGKRQGASTITQQVAQELLPFLGKDLYPQALRSAAVVQDREQSQQGPDPRALHQPDLSRAARLRLRRRRADLFRQAAEELTLAEAAMLAGLPKAPSAYNPVVNPKRARMRQQYVLRRMNELGFITDAQHEAALEQAW